MTSIDKALEVCEVLSGVPRGMSLSDLARALRQPASTVHRLLGVLKKRGYVRQDDETQRYGLTLKMLDLSFRSLGQSELRLHAYPIMREYVLRTPYRGFIAIPAAVTTSGAPVPTSRHARCKEMPGHPRALSHAAPGDTAPELPAGSPRKPSSRRSHGRSPRSPPVSRTRCNVSLRLRAGARYRTGSGASASSAMAPMMVRS
jgi:hypothetical protein